MDTDTAGLQDLAGQRILVVGAGSGIGRAVVDAALAAGAMVAAFGRPGPSLDRLASQALPGVRVAPLDLADGTAIAPALAEAAPFDHVVSTAAHALRQPFGEIALDAARAAFDVKFWGQVALAQAAAQRLPAHGSIVLVSGISSRRGLPTHAIQGAINGALEALARSLAAGLAPIRVNAVAPGYIDTPRHGSAPDQATLARIGQTLPVGRVGRPEEVAATILHLMANRFLNGTVIDIDGGHTAT
ncbi:SDR family oxidoreductase [Zavarzinia sp. CC-PAN008]|uniref:SDR family oxidoreductase n=1 Tax=Zavarzinia sp. CC-PAN008 TaxID=3243332 RepID=UPI003F743EEF